MPSKQEAEYKALQRKMDLFDGLRKEKRQFIANAPYNVNLWQIVNLPMHDLKDLFEEMVAERDRARVGVVPTTFYPLHRPKPRRRWR